MFRRDSNAVVRYREDPFLAAAFRGQLDSKRTIASVFHRIRKQVLENAVQQTWNGSENRQRPDVQACSPSSQLIVQLLLQGAHNSGNIHNAGRPIDRIPAINAVLTS